MPLTQLDADILYEIVGEVASTNNKDHRRCLLNLSLACRTLLHATRPIIFAKVKWPHPNQHDKKSGLHFPPEVLWPYIKSFHLDWPDHWPDLSPPLWGTKGTFGKGVYHPKHLDKVELALPRMNNIHTFQITCPFYPPTSLLTALVRCPNIKDLKVIDTPLYTDVVPVIPPHFNLESFSLVAVGEALRVGEGPFDPRYRSIAYFSREYRRKHFNDIHGRFASIRYLFQLTRTNHLRYLQLSGGSFTLLDLEEHNWPNLNTLVLTGTPPLGGVARLVDVVARMPNLFDLRVLFAKTNRHQAFEILPPPWPEANLSFPHDDRFKKPNTIFSQITRLTVSNACNLQNTFQHVPNLERLVITALAEHPRLPIACSMLEMTGVLNDIILGGGNAHLKQVRLIMEDNIPVSLLKTMGDKCPLLEFVEVELCQYQEQPSDVDADWSEFSDAFSNLQHLRELRIAIPRVGCNPLCSPSPAHVHFGECVRANRKICATYLATRLPTLRKVGLQYRIRTGGYRSEERWLDYRIERWDDGSGKVHLHLHELGQTWYPFPEVWESVPLDE